MQLSTFMIENWMLFVALLIILILLAMNSVRGKLLGFKEIKPAQAVQIMNHDEPLILDTRTREEFEQGHISTAHHIPYNQIAERCSELEQFKPNNIIVYCRTGQRSAQAASILVKKGFATVYKVNGGMLAWQKADLPLETTD